MDKPTEIESRGISNEPFSIVGNARINGKCGQTWTLTSFMRSAIQDTLQQPQGLLQALDNDSPFQVHMGIERKATGVRNKMVDLETCKRIPMWQQSMEPMSSRKTMHPLRRQTNFIKQKIGTNF